MANRRIEVDIVANDKASSVFKSVGSASSSMASTLMGALGGTVNAVGNLDSVLRSYNASMWRYNRVVGSVIRTAGDSIYNFTRDAINNFTELEQQHAKTMGAMATEYGKTADAQAKFLSDSEKLKKQALTLGTVGPNGKGSLYSPVDISYAQTALVKSGMSADDLLNSNAVSSILQFAGGNDLDIDTATTFAVNLATVFDKPVEEWGKMLDMVTKAADISVIDVEDIMESLTYTGGIASGLGRDLEEVLGVISVMGQAGLRGRVAGTGLQALFTRILSNSELSDTQVDKAPTKYVGQVYNAFLEETTNKDGTFKNMDEVAASLDVVMESLNDQEQAWFAKKLFGLYQMKAAYALTGAIDGDTNMITDFINQIANQSEGTNEIKYELMQASQYGKIESLKNAWVGVKTDVGDRLSPVVSAVADEFFAFLTNNGNYDINWDKLRQAFEESGDLIGEQYGQQLGKLIEDAGNFTINAGLIANTLTPEAGGILEAIIKLLNGDISGALESFWGGLKDTNEEIEDLPPELQDTANAAKDVIAAFTILSGINLSTQILQIITTAFNTFIGKPIKAIRSLINSTTSTTNATTATVSATSATVNIGSVSLMNVTASVVNVYGGGSGSNPTNPTNPTSPTSPTTPSLPSGSGGSPILPWAVAGGGGYALGNGGKLLLPGGSGTSTGTFNTSGAKTLYDVGGGKMMSMSEIVASIAKKTAISAAVTYGSLSLFGSPGLLKSNDKRVQEGSDWLNRYVIEGNTNYSDIAGNARVYDWIKNQSGYTGKNSTSIVEAEMAGRTAAREEMMSFYKSDGGIAALSELFETQIEQNGKITEEFLSAITQWTKDGYTYSGSNDDIKEILDFMYSNFSKDYNPSSSFFGKFNDSAINKFLNGDNTLNTIIKNNEDIINNTQSVIDGVNDAMGRIQNPIVNVNVTTNVDKSGNATTNTNVDIGTLSRSIARQASRYGINNSAK